MEKWKIVPFMCMLIGPAYAFMTHPETPLQQVVTDKSRLHWDIQYKNKPIRPHVPGHILRMEHPAEIRYSLHMG